MNRFNNANNSNKEVVIAFRRQAASSNIRTFISSILPSSVGVSDSCTLIFSSCCNTQLLCLYAITNSKIFDYVVRLKVTSNNINNFIVKQLPVLRPDQIDEQHRWEIVKRVAELTYFNHDMDAFADELAAELTDEQNAQLDGRLERKDPWTFNEERRALLMAELDAIIASLYGLNEEELMYILDPETKFGEGCIHETFRVLKENETKEFGEYRTYRLVMDAWQRLQAGTLFN